VIVDFRFVVDWRLLIGDLSMIESQQINHLKSSINKESTIKDREINND